MGKYRQHVLIPEPRNINISCRGSGCTRLVPDDTSHMVTMGRTVAFNNSNWASLYKNLSKAQRWLGVVVKLLTKTGVMVRAPAMMYRAVVQIVLLYGSNSCVVK